MFRVFDDLFGYIGEDNPLNSWPAIFNNKRNAAENTNKDNDINARLLRCKYNESNNGFETIRDSGFYLSINILHGGHPLLEFGIAETSNFSEFVRQKMTTYGDFVHYYFKQTTLNKKGTEIIYIYIYIFYQLFS